MSTKKKDIPLAVNFAVGGTSGMAATLFVQPLDLIKNRMQLSKASTSNPSALSVLSQIIKNEGFLKLYNGLSAGLLRQAFYTTTRLGVYNSLLDRVTKGSGQNPSFLQKGAIGLTAGGIGAFVGTPAEVCLIRMTADGRLPVAERRNYTSVFNALSRIVREEGVLTLWRGCVPTIGRAMVVNMVQLAVYSEAKQQLLATGAFKEGLALHAAASMISGIATTLASMPVDITKTRLQNMKIGPDGTREYKGVFDVLTKIIRKEGVFALWKGILPYYFRLGPHTVLTFIFMEQMNNSYRKNFVKNA